MKNTLGFWGIVLFLIFNFSYGNRTTAGCGYTSDNCENICDICDRFFFDQRIRCYELLITETCFKPFNTSMSTLNTKDFCQWNSIKSPYDNFTICTEERADCLLIPWPNKLVESMFVEIHSNYFKSCPTQGLDDPPPSIVFALVMTPICLIPVMVVLVVMKTKNGDRRS
ncbi:hypothetical protein SKAU_G00134370 [Synaphobranchus kaupii]|uniref:Receptor (G protein-coupled) activity modifying protein 2 n=1 Tax=Synaphobranchus kaupii TaxID=118154 RepID=A0A9Q1FRK3_SYNKA|nr:hypothetical protein SKAU_G00134370 [Synaphobranchus kaupii]